MKARVKFRKYGEMRFIGHLDLLRYFQKVLRRANVPIAFTAGYSPHMILSFANPLGVGMTSAGEYFDMELTEEIDCGFTREGMNCAMVNGIDVASISALREDAKPGMSVVAAADYLVSWNEGSVPPDWKEKLDDFMLPHEIQIVKQTKKSEKEVNIRPMIYQMEPRGNQLYMLVATGSVENLKPSLVMKAFHHHMRLPEDTFSYAYQRQDIYADNQDDTGKSIWTPLSAYQSLTK